MQIYVLYWKITWSANREQSTRLHHQTQFFLTSQTKKLGYYLPWFATPWRVLAYHSWRKLQFGEKKENQIVLYLLKVDLCQISIPQFFFSYALKDILMLKSYYLHKINNTKLIMPKEHLFLLVIQRGILSGFSLNTSATVEGSWSAHPTGSLQQAGPYAAARQCEEKRWSDQSLAEDQLWEGGSVWHHLSSTLPTLQGRARRGLWAEVLSWWTRWSILSCPDYVLKTSKKAKLEIRKRSSYFLFSCHSWRQSGSRLHGLSGSCTEGRQVWGGCCCTTPHLQHLSAAQALHPYSTTRALH